MPLVATAKRPRPGRSTWELNIKSSVTVKPRDTMTFITSPVYSLSPVNHKSNSVSSSPSSCSFSPSSSPSRRKFLHLVSSAVLGVAVNTSFSSAAQSSASDWDPEDLCKRCEGRGRQPCSLCEGTGTLSINDSVVQQDHLCPTCQGAGNVPCPACIGLGLADVKGILRNGVRDGTLRMRKNGSYEIMDCSAFPSCDVYGGGTSPQLQ